MIITITIMMVMTTIISSQRAENRVCVCWHRGVQDNRHVRVPF